MRFVTGETGRFEAVHSVARHAGNLRVLARVCDELIADGTVAVEAIVCKLGRHGDLLWRVRIGMAHAAFSDLWPMWSFMAGGTLGHNCIIIPLARAIGVEDIMTVLAGETVSPTVILEVLELSVVALGALDRRERLWFTGVHLRGRRYRNRRDLFPLRLCKRCPHERQCDYDTCQDALDCDTVRCSHFPSLYSEYSAHAMTSRFLLMKSQIGDHILQKRERCQ